MKTAYDSAILVAATKYELDADLLIAQVVVESSGQADAFHYDPDFYVRYIRNNPKACAKAYGPDAACSRGLLQIEFETACEIGFTGLPHQLYDPAVNLEWGAKYLRSLLDWASGDYERALIAYNAGKGGATTEPYSVPGSQYASKVFIERDRRV